ncbi:MAG: hypothetical protein QXP08_04165 [Sulfolobales archaeon]
MRYLVIVGDKLALLLVNAVLKFDSKAHITILATSKEVVEQASSLNVDQVLEGVESLSSKIDLKLVDVAIVQLESTSNSCELGRNLKRSGVPLVIAFTATAEASRVYADCGFSFLIHVGQFIESALGSIIGLDTWVEIPIRSFANLSVKAYRVFRRARLGISLRDITSEVSSVRGLVALYDKDGSYITSSDYLIAEGDLIVVASPTDRDLQSAVERLNKLFMLAERVYTALESRRPPG